MGNKQYDPDRADSKKNLVNIQNGELKQGIIDKKISINGFIKQVMKYIDAGACVIGACCGSNPYYIKALRALIDINTKKW